MVKALKWKGNSPAEGRPLRQIADVLTGAVPLEKVVRGKILHTLAILAAEPQPGGSGNGQKDEGAVTALRKNVRRWVKGIAKEWPGRYRASKNLGVLPIRASGRTRRGCNVVGRSERAGRK